MIAATRRKRHLPYPLRVVHARPRLFTAVGVGIVSFFALQAAVPMMLSLPTRVCLAWDLGIAVYLVLCAWMMATTPANRIARRADAEDEGRVGILVLTAAAAMASLVAIFAQLGTPDARGTGRILMLIVTILLSWAFTHTIFAVHYAHEFYDEDQGSGLNFPGDEPPDYWDFIYFSFVIGMTSQVSDVAVTARNIRRTAIAHGMVSFVFNAALVALTVNIAASAV